DRKALSRAVHRAGRDDRLDAADLELSAAATGQPAEDRRRIKCRESSSSARMRPMYKVSATDSECVMFGSFGTNAYAQVEVETGVATADPHKLVGMLYEGLLQSIARGREAMLAKE